MLAAGGDGGADGLKRGGEESRLFVGLGEFGVFGFGAFEAGKGLVVQAVYFGAGELEFVLDGCGLFSSGDAVELFAKARDLFAVGGDLDCQFGAQGVLFDEGGGGRRGKLLSGLEGGIGAGDLCGQSAHLFVETDAIQLQRLESYKVLNTFLHG